MKSHSNQSHLLVSFVRLQSSRKSGGTKRTKKKNQIIDIFQQRKNIRGQRNYRWLFSIYLLCNFNCKLIHNVRSTLGKMVMNMPQRVMSIIIKGIVQSSIIYANHLIESSIVKRTTTKRRLA